MVWSRALRKRKAAQKGFTLIELIVFMVVVSIALGSMILVYNQSLINSVDPLIRVQMAELAQSQLDKILARKYDEATPTGGIPACGSAESGAIACVGLGLDAGENLATEATLDDVDDFHNFNDTPYAGYTRSVAISFAGADLGIADEQAKLLTITVTGPNNQQLTLSAYRVNF